MRSKYLRLEQLERREVLSGATAVSMAPHTLPPASPAALVATPLLPNKLGPASAQAFTTVVAPMISGIGGVTNNGTGICNGKVNETWGQTYNGLQVVNDRPGYYPWTVNGTNFGTIQGTATLNGRSVPILAWTNTSIKVDASGTQFNPQQPWNWGPMCTTLVVKTASGQQVTRGVNVAPAISQLIYGQCTYWAAYQRVTMGRTPYASPYNSANQITSSWVPQRGDQLVWSVASTGGKHTGVITSVSKTVSGNKSVYNLTISQMNANCDNKVTTFNTTFTVTRQTNGALVVSILPKFSTNSSGAYGYDR